MAFKREVIERLDRLAEQQHKHNVELALNTRVLTDHHVRASQMESRIVPLEQSQIFVNKLAKVLMGLVTSAAGLAAVYHYLFIK